MQAVVMALRVMDALNEQLMDQLAMLSSRVDSPGRGVRSGLNHRGGSESKRDRRDRRETAEAGTGVNSERGVEDSPKMVSLDELFMLQEVRDDHIL